MRSFISSAREICKAVLPVSAYKALASSAKQARIRAGIAGGGKIYIPYLVLCVGQACNFRCQNCGNFAPYSPKESLLYPLEDIERDLETLFSVVTKIDLFHIQGGEPFCYSDLYGLLEYVREKKLAKRIGKIIIATNGSIMPSDELFSIIKEIDAEVRISDYDVMPAKAKALKDRCQKEGMHYWFYSFANGQGMWYDCGGIETPRDPDDAAVKKRFKDCDFHRCLTLENGEIAHCSRAVNSCKVQGFTCERGDTVSLSDKAALRDELIKYITQPHFMEACRYCNGTNRDKMIAPAVQIPKNADRL